MIIGLTGPIASGKATIIGVLKGKGFHSVTMSDIIREEMEKNGLPLGREQMQDFSYKMKVSEGEGVWVRRCVEKAQKEGWKDWVIDGIRGPVEIQELRKHPDFVLVGVLSSHKDIIGRIQARKRDIDPQDPAEIQRRIWRDWGLNEPPEGQQVGLCVAQADYFFVNDGSVEDLKKGFAALYDRIQSKR